MKPTETTQQHRAWHIANRWQEYEGEMRAAVLRVVLVSLFYSIQLMHFLSVSEPTPSDRILHRSVTLSVAVWLLLSLGVLVSLRGNFMPRALKYVVTGIDLALLTLIAWLGHGASSPLVTALFLVLALSAIRFRIGLIWFATIGSMACYMWLVGQSDNSWFDENHSTPIIAQSITLCSLASTGIVLGQIVRAARSMSQAYLERVENTMPEVTE
jgi:hypothetical protein